MYLVPRLVAAAQGLPAPWLWRPVQFGSRGPWDTPNQQFLAGATAGTLHRQGQNQSSWRLSARAAYWLTWDAYTGPSGRHLGTEGAPLGPLPPPPAGAQACTSGSSCACAAEFLHLLPRDPLLHQLSCHQAVLLAPRDWRDWTVTGKDSSSPPQSPRAQLPAYLHSCGLGPRLLIQLNMEGLPQASAGTRGAGGAFDRLPRHPAHGACVSVTERSLCTRLGPGFDGRHQRTHRDSLALAANGRRSQVQRNAHKEAVLHRPSPQAQRRGCSQKRPSPSLPLEEVHFIL